MTILLTIIHIIVSVILILVVLLQTGKRADLAGAFGGGGSQTAFGPRGAATWLSKVTTGAAVMFMLTSVGLAILTSKATRTGGDSVLDDAPTAVTAPAETGGTDDATGGGAVGGNPEGTDSDAPAGGDDADSTGGGE